MSLVDHEKIKENLRHTLLSFREKIAGSNIEAITDADIREKLKIEIVPIIATAKVVEPQIVHPLQEVQRKLGYEKKTKLDDEICKIIVKGL